MGEQSDEPKSRAGRFGCGKFLRRDSVIAVVELNLLTWFVSLGDRAGGS